MPRFVGIDHLSLSVTDLDVSERFYTEVLGFLLVVDFGQARILLDRGTGFTLSLVRHSAGSREPFSERNPGLDHVGLTAGSREELVAWKRRFAAAGVVFTPIRDMPFGAHLNVRDPDGIPLEFVVPNDALTAGYQMLRERDLTREESNAYIREQLLTGGVPESELPESLRPVPLVPATFGG